MSELPTPVVPMVPVPPENVGIRLMEALYGGVAELPVKLDAIGIVLDTLKLCATVGAARYVLLPPWLASMVQVPATRRVAVVPETVHTLVVVELKETASPLVAEADSVTGVPTVCAPGLPK